ncbi:MAG: DegT/DnrJ/EryC1/StrS family aminotransferase [Pseudomonadota bacterium]
MKYVDLERQYRRIQQDIDTGIKAVLEHGKYINGPEVAQLETRLAQTAGTAHAIGCANGTDALVLALMALDIGPGHAVIVPTFTFFATAEAVRLVGAVPVFVDIDERSYNIDPAAIEKAIASHSEAGGPDLKAIITVDLFGLPADYDAISDIASSQGLYLIEDGAQSFGGSLGGRMACSFGDIATTSFFPAKPLGCYGDGGALFTPNDDLAEVIRSLRQHGQGKDKYNNVRIGMNSRLDSLQAAVLNGKLSVFTEEIEARNAVADRYTEALSETFVTPLIPSGYRSAWAQYTIRSRGKSREFFQGQLKEAGIPTAVYYATPLHLQPAFADFSSGAGACPVAEQVSAEVFSLPMHPYLEDAEVTRVIDALLAAA